VGCPYTGGHSPTSHPSGTNDRRRSTSSGRGSPATARPLMRGVTVARQRVDAATGGSACRLQQLPGDDQALDLTGPLVDGLHARIAHVPLHRELVDVAVAAVELHSLVRGPV